MSAFRKPQLRGYFGGMFDAMDAYEYLEQGNIAEYEKIMEEHRGEVPKSRKIKDAFYKELVLDYEYDFGSSTELTITVIDEYASMPVVNSPRMGVCAYEGGIIDKERDGIFVLK